MARKLSATQVEVLRRMASGDRLVRWPGGFWTIRGIDESRPGVPVWYVGAQTVRAMECLGLLEQCNGCQDEWRADRCLTLEGRALCPES